MLRSWQQKIFQAGAWLLVGTIVFSASCHFREDPFAVSAIALYVRAPHLQYRGKLWLVQELPKNRRRTEVPVSFSGSAGAVGRHNNNSK